jgi:hypothetical protein
MKVKMQLFINGAYAYRKSLDLVEKDKQAQLTAMFQQALRSLDREGKYQLDITEVGT